MEQIYKVISIIQMIEDGYLMTIRQIELEYGLTHEQIEEAVRNGDLEKIRFAGKDYFIFRQVEMLRDAIHGG